MIYTDGAQWVARPVGWPRAQRADREQRRQWLWCAPLCEGDPASQPAQGLGATWLDSTQGPELEKDDRNKVPVRSSSRLQAGNGGSSRIPASLSALLFPRGKQGALAFGSLRASLARDEPGF